MVLLGCEESFCGVMTSLVFMRDDKKKKKKNGLVRR
jgi:hypothetical protein